MLCIAVELLTGRYYATAYNDRSRCEWPPHPARLFSALVAAWSEGGDEESAERSALDWLAEQGAPAIWASPASFRDVTAFFVPVNDEKILRDQGALFSKLCAAEEEMREAAVLLEKQTDLKARKKSAKIFERKEKAVQKILVSASKYIRPKVASAPPPDDNEQLELMPFQAAPAPYARDTVDLEPALLPATRKKMERTFPSATPESSTIWFVWSAAEPSHEVRNALNAVLARTTRLGHSASLVACRLADEAPSPNYLPDDNGQHLLRTVSKGQVADLCRAFERHQGNEPRVLPSKVTAYREGGRVQELLPPRSIFGDWIVFERVEGPRLPVVRGVDVAEALRGTLMSAAEQPVDSALSGHLSGGQRLQAPHVAFVSLPYVGSKYADGSILGVAMLLPRELTPTARRAVLRAVGFAERIHDDGQLHLRLGRAGVLEVVRVEGLSHKYALQPARWARAARTWLSATPVALDRNPGNLFSEATELAERAAARASETIARACERVGLPRPALVELRLAEPASGIPAARRFPPYPQRKHKTRRVLVHARIQFTEPVQGPVLIGAGRYRGLGLFMPQKDKE